MAETKTPLKRQREETQVEGEEIEETKRQRPYHYLWSILDEEEEEPHQDDLSSLMDTLQQELSSSEPDYPSSHLLSETTPSEAHPIDIPTTTTTTTTTTTDTAAGNFDLASASSPILLFKDDSDKEEEEQKRSTIIRHLLEASDDELGIPQTQIRLQTTKYDQHEDITIHGGGIYSGANNNGEEGTAISSLFDFHDGFCDFEDFDQTAHYYTLSQSELFM